MLNRDFLECSIEAASKAVKQWAPSECISSDGLFGAAQRVGGEPWAAHHPARRIRARDPAPLLGRVAGPALLGRPACSGVDGYVRAVATAQPTPFQT